MTFKPWHYLVGILLSIIIFALGSTFEKSPTISNIFLGFGASLLATVFVTLATDYINKKNRVKRFALISLDYIGDYQELKRIIEAYYLRVGGTQNSREETITTMLELILLDNEASRDISICLVNMNDDLRFLLESSILIDYQMKEELRKKIVELMDNSKKIRVTIDAACFTEKEALKQNVLLAEDIYKEIKDEHNSRNIPNFV